MNFPPKLILGASLLLTAAVPAFATTTISRPAKGAHVPGSFPLVVKSSGCSSRPVIALGYSFDGNDNTVLVRGASISRTVTSANGSHTIHVKAWNNRGGLCVTDVVVHVNGATPPPTSNNQGGGDATALVPGNATVVSNLQTLRGWFGTHDRATKGTSNGSTVLAHTPALSRNSRAFSTTLANHAGHRFAVGFGDDDHSHNFLYDTWVYIKGSAKPIANLEFDMNQTMVNGQTVIMGFQCDGWSGTWDYTENAGTAHARRDTWRHSNEHCDPQEWTPNKWHHMQVMYSRNDQGWVTYKSVWLDGNRQDLGYQVFSAFALGWDHNLITNFQVDSATSKKSSSTVYLDKFTVYRW